MTSSLSQESLTDEFRNALVNDDKMLEDKLISVLDSISTKHIPFNRRHMQKKKE
jgi:hypothetical protein